MYSNIDALPLGSVMQPKQGTGATLQVPGQNRSARSMLAKLRKKGFANLPAQTPVGT